MNEKQRLEKKYHSVTHYVLTSLIPYSEANLKLAFKPNLFFDDLEKLDAIKISRRSLRTSYYRAIKKGLVTIDNQGIPRLTVNGMRKLKYFKPKKLDKKAKLLLAFDIPESERWKRSRMRLLLKELSFVRVQKSVWESPYDCRDYIKAEIEETNLKDYVVIYEASRLKV